MEEFKLYQYQKLNDEISNSLEQIASIEKYSIVFSGGVFAWLFSKDCIIPDFAFFIPVIIVFLLGLVSFGIYKRICLIGEYIKSEYEDLEYPEEDRDLIKFKNMGWETFLILKNSKVLISTRTAMWILHLIITIAIAFYGVKSF